jgi:hypothetical protein
VLPLEGDCVNASLPKYNFGPEALDRLLLALWTRPDLLYIHERTRVQFAFLIHVYCWTGARLSAFFKKKEGLQYKVNPTVTSARRPNCSAGHLPCLKTARRRRWLRTDVEDRPTVGQK